MVAGGGAGPARHGRVGKTQLAAEFVYRHRDDYDLIAWIDAENADLIPGQLADLAPPLGLPADAGRLPDPADQLRHGMAPRAAGQTAEWSHNWSQTKRNALPDDLWKGVCPRSGARI